VTFLPREGRVGANICVQVSRKHRLDLARRDDPLRLAVGELHPVVQDVVSDPVNQLVYAGAACLGQASLFLDVADAAGDPVVRLSAVDFADEPDLVAT
jgi:hypothetical protein